MKWKTTSLVILFCILSTGWAAAQTTPDFNMDWFTLEAGESSRGGDFALTGGISASESVRAGGGDYGMVGGFWSILPSLEIGEPPVLRIAIAGPGSVLISWPAPSTGWVLEQSQALGAPSWTDVNAPVIPQGPDNTVVQSVVSGSRFYRLRHP